MTTINAATTATSPEDIDNIQKKLLQINNMNLNKNSGANINPTVRPMTSSGNPTRRIQQQHENIVDSLIGKAFSKSGSTTGLGHYGNNLDRYEIGITLGQGSYAIV